MNLKQLSDYDLGLYHYEYLGPAIHQLIDEQGYKISTIVELTGVPRSTLYHFFKGNRDLPSSRVFLILKILGISNTEFLAYVRENSISTTKSALLTSFDLKSLANPDAFKANLNELSIVDLSEILLNLSVIIDIQITDNLLKEQLQNKIVDIANARIYKRIGRLTPAEMELFNNIMRFMNWAQVKSLFNELVNEIDHQTKALETSSDLNMSARFLSIMANVLFNLGTLAIQNGDIEQFKKVNNFAENRDTPYYDWHGRFIARLLQVINLYLHNDIKEAEQLYNKLISAMSLLITERNQLFYANIIEHDFDSFIGSILNK